EIVGLDGADVLASLASTISEIALGPKDEVEVLFRRSLALREAELGPDDLQLCVTLNELGICVQAAGRLDESEELFKRSLAIKEAKLGPEDLQVADTLH
ncbi:unnamed protein product, partial [Scytosiphon promiscuus]